VRDLTKIVVAVLSSCVMVLAAILVEESETLMLLAPLVAWAYYGGVKEGVAATIVMTAGALVIGDGSNDHAYWLAPLGIGALVTWLCDHLRRARLRDRQHAQQALQWERRFSESFHASPLGMALIQVDSQRITDVNRELARLLGLPREDIVGTTLASLGVMRDEDQARLARRVQRSGVIANEHVELQGRDGVRRVRLFEDLVVIDARSCCLMTVLDETEQLAVEETLKETDARFRELAGAVSDVFWVTTLDRRTTLYISPAYEKTYGRSIARLYEDPTEWMAAIHRDDRERLIKAMMENPLPDHMVDEFRITRTDGEIRWIRNASFTVRDADGTPLRLAGISSDITDQRMLQEQLRHTQKMDGLGLLAGGVAHDFNNVLAVISSCNGMLGETLGADETDARELVDEVQAAVSRAAGLTRQLLAFSRKQVTAPVVLDVNAVVKDTRKMLVRVLGEHIRLETSLDPDLRHVLIDAGSLVQVVMNLAVNARDAMPLGGKLSISTRMERDRVLIAVRDEGCGMPEEVRTRIFEPFFTTKEVGRGTGLGLAVVHGIVEQAGGRIEVESTPAVGTLFEISLPAVDAAERASAKRITVLPRGVETILLVDDDPYVRKAMARSLRAFGYEVVEAADADTALGLLDARPVDLLLTDVVMPYMDGRQLAEAAQRRRPGLKVLFASGYTDDEVLRHGVRRQEMDLLEKPFVPLTLTTKVRQVLDRPQRLLD
jgi:two-component system, cell cycle sensor histidine kinase and response regulator CckA